VKEVSEFSDIPDKAKLTLNEFRLLGNNKCEISITCIGEKLVVTLNIANPETSSLRANAVPIGTFYDNRIFLVVVTSTHITTEDNKLALGFFCGATFDCVSGGTVRDDLYSNESFAGAIYLERFVKKKYLTFDEDGKSPKTIHLCRLY
jgi:hypothetical protein